MVIRTVYFVSYIKVFECHCECTVVKVTQNCVFGSANSVAKFDSSVADFELFFFCLCFVNFRPPNCTIWPPKDVEWKGWKNTAKFSHRTEPFGHRIWQHQKLQFWVTFTTCTIWSI